MDKSAPEHQSHESLSRRDALKIIAGSLGVVLTAPHSHASSLLVAGQDPSLGTSAPYSPRFFNPEQMQTLDTISEAIIPADEHSPGARAARVNEYLDVVLSEASKERQRLWQDGLAALDNLAELDSGKKFKDCNQDEQRNLLERMSQNEEHPTTIEERFFVAVKKSTVEGYYTSEIGIHQDLEYQGNDVLLNFDGCKHDTHPA